MEWLLYGFLALWGILFLYLADKKKSKTIDNNNDHYYHSNEDINPANGIKMLDKNIDVEGNPYGSTSEDDFGTTHRF